MCGRMNLIDIDALHPLFEFLGIPTLPEPRLNITPGSSAEFIISTAEDNQLLSGVWSLLLEPKPNQGGYRPNPKFKTFNARANRLTTSPLWRSAYQSHRCVIPVTGFHEWHNKQCYQITPASGRPILLAGLYRSYQFEQITVHGFSVITLAGEPRFQHIHEKSFPLMLHPTEVNIWLDPTFHDTDQFTPLFGKGIRTDIKVLPVQSPTELTPIGDSEIIKKNSLH